MSQPWSPEYRALRAARAELRRPKGGEKCRCGKPANIVCTCGCGAAACRQCIREGRIG